MFTVGVIGCGYWGPNLIRNFNSLDGCMVTAVCDARADRLAAMKKAYPGLETFSDDVQFVKSRLFDAVVVCTPVSTHYSLAVLALESGYPVLIEKPMTATVREAETLCQLAENRGLTLMVDHTFLYTGAVRKAKELIDSGELGEILYFDSVRVNLGLFQHDINVLWDLAPHDISIMDFLVAKKVLSVGAVGVSHFGTRIENIAYVSVLFEDGVLGHIHVNWLAPVKVRTALIGGTRKMIVYDDSEPSEKIKIYDKGVQIRPGKEEIYRMLVEYRTGDMVAPKLDSTEALRLVAREFHDAVTQNRRPRTTGEDGARVVRILETAGRSMKESGRMLPV